jgi:hypothetical protein
MGGFFFCEYESEEAKPSGFVPVANPNVECAAACWCLTCDCICNSVSVIYIGVMGN